MLTVDLLERQGACRKRTYVNTHNGRYFCCCSKTGQKRKEGRKEGGKHFCAQMDCSLTKLDLFGEEEKNILLADNAFSIALEMSSFLPSFLPSFLFLLLSEHTGDAIKLFARVQQRVNFGNLKRPIS